MTFRIRLAVLLAPAVLFAGCATDTPLAPFSTGPWLQISDAAHGGGNAHFYFLPPMAPPPEYAGVFDGTLSPTVVLHVGETVIDELVPQVSLAGEHYLVEWHTDLYELDPATIYRLSVQVDRYVLGFADVQLVSVGAQLKNVNTEEFVALKDGRTLPVRFRIEEGALPEGLIVFDYFDGANRDIYRVNPDGTALTRLTNHVGSNPYTSNNHPNLSPDRQRIVFSREWNLWMMNADGTGAKQLTFVAPNTLPNIAADWSPDGTRIVWESQFACCAIPNREIHTMNADGSNNVRLTYNSVWDGWPSWSPDGARIVYNVGDGSGSGLVTEVYRMNADGTNVVRLTDNDVNEYRPVYSPDGTKIAFFTDRDGHWEVYVMQADGSQQTRLTVSPAGGSWYPDWSPSGDRILFASDRAGTWDLYVMNADGSGVTQITALASTEHIMATWR